jgi:hypothetical protein
MTTPNRIFVNMARTGIIRLTAAIEPGKSVTQGE